MPKYVYIHTGGRMAENEQESKRLRDAWIAFVGGLGESIVDGGNQFGAAKTVSGNSTSGASGYTIVNAASIDKAIERARPCPIFDQGGDVEVYEAG